MIEAQDFVEAARARGFSWYAGVPCSFLTPFINYVIGDPGLRYISAANEGDAVALAAGAAIGGQRSVAMMQNSGLGNAVSPLTSLTYTFRIPLLVICTHRGAPGVSDEPQHELMGQITDRLFATMDIPCAPFPQAREAVATTLDAVDHHLQESRRPFGLIMQKGSCAPYALAPQGPHAVVAATANVDGEFERRPDARASRAEVLDQLVAATSTTDTVIIASTGFSGRELYATADRENHLYMVGSMGCASSLGLGLALARPDLNVIVVDGDGAALMRMGNLATVGAYKATNFYHLLLDNEAHDSTGAQATVSADTDFAAIAAACGYRNAVRSDDPASVTDLTGTPGPRLLHLKIRTGARPDLPRPAIAPADVLARLMQHIGAR